MTSEIVDQIKTDLIELRDAIDFFLRYHMPSGQEMEEDFEVMKERGMLDTFESDLRHRASEVANAKRDLKDSIEELDVTIRECYLFASIARGE